MSTTTTKETTTCPACHNAELIHTWEIREDSNIPYSMILAFVLSLLTIVGARLLGWTC